MNSEYSNSEPIKLSKSSYTILCHKIIAYIVLEQIVITCFGISDQFSDPVQEFMLKNDTLKNGTSRIGLYESANWIFEIDDVSPSDNGNEEGGGLNPPGDT